MRRALLLLCLLLAGPAEAQRAAAPVFLGPGHWTWDALRRLGAAGLAPAASDPTEAPVTVAGASVAFEHAAAAAAAAGRRDLAQLAADYGALLRAEYGGLLPESAAPRALGRASLRGGWTAATGEALGGDGYFPDEDWEGARPIPDASGPAMAVRLDGHLLRWLSWSADAGWLGAEWTVAAAGLAAAVGPFDGWLGRRHLHYGAGRGGGTVLGSGTGVVPDLAHRTVAYFDGVGLHVREPFLFPAPVRFLGPTRIELVAGRLDRVGRRDGPFVVFGRLTGSPFSRRFMLGINRGAIFAGDGIPITLRRLAGLLVGEHGGEGGEFENQIFSVVARYRPPLGPVPLEVYLEWGMDDTSGAVRDTPGIVAGVDLAAVPGLSAMAVGLEHTTFPRACCGKPIWYRHIFYRGSWTDGGRLFAHPVAGHGREWLAHTRFDLPAPGLLVRAEAFDRRRGEENLFAPERAGTSRGGSIGVSHVWSEAVRLSLDAHVERGSGWHVQRWAALLSYTASPGSK
jgi:hypothetical protein